jgi:hypothetical protein
MTRPTFLAASSAVAIAVAIFALGFPHALLEGKGVEPNAATVVWVREVGALILASAVTIALLRKAPDSTALRAVLVGNALLHFTLFPIELAAFSQGVITELSGFLPNSVLHVVLCAGFAVHAWRVRAS